MHGHNNTQTCSKGVGYELGHDLAHQTRIGGVSIHSLGVSNPHLLHHTHSGPYEWGAAGLLQICFCDNGPHRPQRQTPVRQRMHHDTRTVQGSGLRMQLLNLLPRHLVATPPAETLQVR